MQPHTKPLMNASSRTPSQATCSFTLYELDHYPMNILHLKNKKKRITYEFSKSSRWLMGLTDCCSSSCDTQAVPYD